MSTRIALIIAALMISTASAQTAAPTGASLAFTSNDPTLAEINKIISAGGFPSKEQIAKLEKNLSVLATVSGSAPMMGFLGTVIGMVQAFIAIAQEEGSVSPKLLSSGIYTAMITTVAGLIVGIIAYLAYNYLVTRVSKVVHKMEFSSIEFIDLLQEPR